MAGMQSVGYNVPAIDMQPLYSPTHLLAPCIAKHTLLLIQVWTQAKWAHCREPLQLHGATSASLDASSKHIRHAGGLASTL